MVDHPLSHKDRDPAKIPVPIEGFFIETPESLFFDVKQVIQPEKWTIAFVRYVPDPIGPRFRNSNYIFDENIRPREGSLQDPEPPKFRKIYEIPDRYTFLSQNYPQYIKKSPYHNFLLQGVDTNCIWRAYDPRETYSFLKQRVDSVPLFQDAVDFLDALSGVANVSSRCLGYSGSLLTGHIDPAGSDFDVLVYGEKNCWRVHEAMTRLMEEHSSDGHFYDHEELAEHYKFRAKGTSVTFAEFQKYENQKTHQGIWRKRDFFLRYVKYPREYEHRWGDLQYEKVGDCELFAIIADDRERIFSPTEYALDGVRIISSPLSLRETELKFMTSSRGRYCEHARVGDQLHIAGSLERVTIRDTGAEFFQVVVGTQSRDYALLVTE